MQCENSSLCGRLTYIASILVLVMFVINAGFIMSNRALQEDLIAQQAVFTSKNNKIQQNSTFANINQSLIQALTTAVIARKDEQIKALLIQNEVNLQGIGAPKQ
ncbi:MAG: hypothetical protein SFW65_05320 [Alphaproteobacteria bacterium]|nr:hypothetical protein [Alphaproteobacteria bacterium]